MVHLRIVVPSYQSEHVLDLLAALPSCTNLIFLERAGRQPEGDVILCDVGRAYVSVIISDLRELLVDVEGSIAIEEVTGEISGAPDDKVAARRRRDRGGVVWEQVDERTSEETELSPTFLAFMVLACLIASVGILLDSPILIVGAMIVGPEFGPIAGFCVALVQRRATVAKRSLTALAVGFPAAITAAFLFTLLIRAVDLTPEGFTVTEHPLTDFISHPDAFSFIVAAFAGIAGMLSLTSAKSGALIGVLVSVTTIPAAANIGVAAAFTEWTEWRGAIVQLAVNLSAIVVAGLATLYVQRLLYLRRRKAHLQEEAREVAGLPIGHRRRVESASYQRPGDG
jgi:uncharacterized hydrophobic protein (TIGR00271 family)